jgi:hypothetical protein
VTEKGQSIGERSHRTIKIGFSLEADSRSLRHGDITVFDRNAVWESSAGLEEVGIRLVAA